MICPNCKREVPDSAKACGYCGSWLSDETAATVQVPKDTGATIAIPEEKGRSPWLRIGVGLVAVVLVVVLSGLAFLSLRDGGEIDNEATIAAAVDATGKAEAIGARTPETPTRAPIPPSAEMDSPPAIGLWHNRYAPGAA